MSQKHQKRHLCEHRLRFHVLWSEVWRPPGGRSELGFVVDLAIPLLVWKHAARENADVLRTIKGRSRLKSNGPRFWMAAA